MKKILISLLLSVSAVAASAQALPGLLIPADARTQAMGGVMVLPKEAQHLDVQAFYGLWAPKTAANSLIGGDVYFRAAERVALTLEGRTFLDKPYDVTSATGQVTGTFRPNDLIIGLGAEVFATDALSIGLKARMASSSVAQGSKGNAFCGDVSVRYSGEMFFASVAGRNLGSKISYGNASYALPALVALGGGIKPDKALTVAAEADYLFAGALMAGLGLEYCIADIVSLRGGFHYGDAAKALPTYASLGLGLQYAGIRLDVTFLTASKTLGNSLMVSLGYAF